MCTWACMIRLILHDVEVDQFSLNRIIAWSPGLEELHFINCATYFDLIASKVLRRLKIDGFKDRLNGFKISTPSIVCLEYKYCPLEDISLRKLPSLESACIYSTGLTFDGQSKFTRVLLHAKRLALFGSKTKVMLEKELPTCSVFCNLFTLEIGEWCLTDDCYVMLRFLQLSPNLEKLTLIPRKPRGGAKGAQTDAMAIDGATFQCPRLEMVTIQCSKEDDGIGKLVKTLLANGIRTEKINITFEEDIKKLNLAEKAHAKQEQEKELSTFE